MIIDKPRNTVQLRQLWQEAFGDEDAFLDSFFATAFSPQRCLCAVEGDTLLGALYWLDTQVCGQKWAYVYAVATALHSRGKGVCHTLMAAIQEKGYAGMILVPGNERLRAFYAGMGYTCFGGIREHRCRAGKEGVAIKEVDGDTFAALRRGLLPPGGVVQEGENLRFLQTQAQLYAGENFLMAAKKEGDQLTALEFLGDASLCPRVLCALGCNKGVFRMPGKNNFAMCRAMKENVPLPQYFGFAFD